MTTALAGAADARVAGGGAKKTDCYAEFDVLGNPKQKGTRVECIDGDPCDMDGRCQGTCTFRVGVCAKQCPGQSSNVTSFKRNTLGLPTPPTPVTSPTCEGTKDVTVVIRGNRKTGTRTGRLLTLVNAGPKSDPDSVTLVCRKRTGTCPPPTTTTTTTTTTTLTGTSTTTSPTSNCCGPERVTLAGGVGTLTVDSLPAFPFPSGVQTVTDVATASNAQCDHPVTVAVFTIPTFPIPPLNYCSRVTAAGCAVSTNGKIGSGTLRDGNGPVGALTNLLTTADSRDGTCDTTTGMCAGVAGTNSTGDIDAVTTASTGGGVRSLIEIPVNNLTWIEQGCMSGSDPNCTGGTPSLCCCFASTFGDEGGDMLITNFNFVLRPTTNVATAQYADKNMDGCSTDAQAQAGPTTLTGTPPAGPCCSVGQAATVVSASVAMSGGAPLNDHAFALSIPSTVSACGTFQGGSCTVSTNPCDF